MNDLVINHNGILATTQDKVSVLTDNNEQSVQRLIRTYKTDLEYFGKLEFKEIRIQAGLGFTYKKIYYLNEQQATLLLTYMKNTPKVREAKKLLVKAFYDMKQELQALKFKHYVDEISSLNAVLINKANRHQRQINGYKSQIKQHNNQIVILKHELAKYEKAHECEIIDENSPKFKPFSKDHLSYKELWREYIDVMRNNNALKIFIEQYRREVAELKEKLADNTKLIQHLAKAQAKLDEAYRTIGAVMSYADGDKYFLEKSTKAV